MAQRLAVHQTVSETDEEKILLRSTVSDMWIVL